MATFNGHRNWDYWNVSLWINNDESLYRMAMDYRRRSRNKTIAASRMLEALQEAGITKTPDGAEYTLRRISAAMD